MSISELALYLIDIDPDFPNRKKIFESDNFINIEDIVSASLGEPLDSEPVKTTDPHSQHYTVAARLNSSHYENQSQNEALSRALLKIRQNYGNTKSSIIRGT